MTSKGPSSTLSHTNNNKIGSSANLSPPNSQRNSGGGGSNEFMQSYYHHHNPSYHNQSNPQYLMQHQQPSNEYLPQQQNQGLAQRVGESNQFTTQVKFLSLTEILLKCPLKWHLLKEISPKKTDYTFKFRICKICTLDPQENLINSALVPSKHVLI